MYVYIYIHTYIHIYIYISYIYIYTYIYIYIYVYVHIYIYICIQLNHELCESMDSIKKLKAEKLAIMQTAKQHEQASGNNRKRKAPSERQVLDKGKRGRR